MNRIKYDKRDRKLYLILAVVSTVIFAGIIIVLRLNLWEDMSSELASVVMIFGTIICPVLAFAAWVMFCDSHTYLKRLEKYGYIVPENKKDYDNDIERLVNEEIKSYTEPSKESSVLALVSWSVSLGMVGFTIFYFIRFSHMLENMSFLGCVAIFVAILWAVFGAYFWRQRSRERYRDDVEYNSPLKKRNHLVEGLVTVVILLAITVFVATNIYTMAKYVERSKEMNETAQVSLFEECEEYGVCSSS